MGKQTITGTGIGQRILVKLLALLTDAVNELRADMNTFVTASGAMVNGVMQLGTLVVSGTTEQFKTTTVLFWKRLGIQFTKAATDNYEFASAYTINTAGATGFFWGAFLIEVTDTGTLTAKAVGADQVYASEALAIAAMPAVTAGSTILGHITIAALEDTKFTCNTDALIDGTDNISCTFYQTAVADLAAQSTTAPSLSGL